jgi:hypothetical protein
MITVHTGIRRRISAMSPLDDICGSSVSYITFSFFDQYDPSSHYDVLRGILHDLLLLTNIVDLEW